MNIEREWKRAAPTHSMLTLEDLVSDFNWRRADPESPLYRNRDDIVDYCAEAEHLRQAIERAVLSVRPNGKVHNHQSRVKLKARLRLGRFMVRDIKRLRRCQTFEALHDCVVGYEVPGIGPVTAYDVATRVGAYLDLAPRYVHLHAGCLQGMRALGLGGHLPSETLANLRVGAYLDLGVLPTALRRLEPDQVEDFLCVYRQVLANVA